MDANADVPCPRRGKWIGGCRFEARYDLPGQNMPEHDDLISFLYSDRVDAVRAICPKTYVCDVCVKCGRSVERPAALPPAGGR